MIDLLVVLEMPDYSRNHLAEKYTVHYWPDTSTHLQRLGDPLLERIRAVQTNGFYGLKAPMIAAMPDLEIICAVGAGYEGIDVVAARERGIVVTHSPGGQCRDGGRPGLGAAPGGAEAGAGLRPRCA